MSALGDIRSRSTASFLKCRYCGRPSALSLWRRDGAGSFRSLLNLTNPRPRKSNRRRRSSNLDIPPNVTPKIPETTGPEIDPGLTHDHIFHRFKVSRKTDLSLPVLPPFTATDNLRLLFIEKVDLCCAICDFRDARKDVQAKRIKTDTLNELLALPRDESLSFALTSDCCEHLIVMCERNLVGDLPEMSPFLLASSDLMFDDSCFPHIELVIKIMIEYVSQFEQQFRLSIRLVMDLLALLNSPDVRERTLLGEFFVYYVNIFTDQRAQIFKKLSNMLVDSWECKFHGFCIAPILRICYAHMKACSPYLKPFTLFVWPLLSSPDVDSFFGLLLSVIEDQCTRYSYLRRIIVRRLLTSFPAPSISQTVTRLTVINQLIGGLSSDEFRSIAPTFASLYAHYSRSDCVKIAKTAMMVWMGKEASKHIASNSETILPVIYDAVSFVIHNHASLGVKAPAMGVMKVMQQMNPSLFDTLHKVTYDPPNRVHHWDQVLSLASRNDPQIDKVGVARSIYKLKTATEGSQSAASHNIPKRSRSTNAYYFF